MLFARSSLTSLNVVQPLHYETSKRIPKIHQKNTVFQVSSSKPHCLPPRPFRSVLRALRGIGSWFAALLPADTLKVCAIDYRAKGIERYGTDSEQ